MPLNILKSVNKKSANTQSKSEAKSLLIIYLMTVHRTLFEELTESALHC